MDATHFRIGLVGPTHVGKTAFGLAVSAFALPDGEAPNAYFDAMQKNGSYCWRGTAGVAAAAVHATITEYGKRRAEELAADGSDGFIVVASRYGPGALEYADAVRNRCLLKPVIIYINAAPPPGASRAWQNGAQVVASENPHDAVTALLEQMGLPGARPAEEPARPWTCCRESATRPPLLMRAVCRRHADITAVLNDRPPPESAGCPCTTHAFRCSVGACGGDAAVLVCHTCKNHLSHARLTGRFACQRAQDPSLACNTGGVHRICAAHLGAAVRPRAWNNRAGETAGICEVHECGNAAALRVCDAHHRTTAPTPRRSVAG